MEWSVRIISKVEYFQPTESAAKLLRHSLGHRHSGHSPGLSAANLPPGREPGLCYVLSHLGGLAGPGLAHHDQDLVIVDGSDQLVLQLVDGQGLSLLQDTH